MFLSILARLLNSFLMIAMPIGLAIFLTRKFHLSWRLWWIGAATFVLSQVGHIPFNTLVSLLLGRTSIVLWTPTDLLIFNAIFGGLSAGLFEEFFRYGMFRWWVKDARSWSRGLLTGAGHGGAESIIIGAIALYGFVRLLILRTADLSQLYSGVQLSQAAQQVQAYWSSPWYAALLGALERLFAIPTHIALAALVLQTFTRKQGFWVGLAVLYHALLDGIVVYAANYLGGRVEFLVGFFAALSVVIIFALRQPDPAAEPASFSPAPGVSFTPTSVEETRDNLENTRYQQEPHDPH